MTLSKVKRRGSQAAELRTPGRHRSCGMALVLWRSVIRKGGQRLPDRFGGPGGAGGLLHPRTEILPYPKRNPLLASEFKAHKRREHHFLSAVGNSAPGNVQMPREGRLACLETSGAGFGMAAC